MSALASTDKKHHSLISKSKSKQFFRLLRASSSCPSPPLSPPIDSHSEVFPCSAPAPHSSSHPDKPRPIDTARANAFQAKSPLHSVESDRSFSLKRSFSLRNITSTNSTPTLSSRPSFRHSATNHISSLSVSTTSSLTSTISASGKAQAAVHSITSQNAATLNIAHAAAPMSPPMASMASTPSAANSSSDDYLAAVSDASVYETLAASVTNNSNSRNTDAHLYPYKSLSTYPQTSGNSSMVFVEETLPLSPNLTDFGDCDYSDRFSAQFADSRTHSQAGLKSISSVQGDVCGGDGRNRAHSYSHTSSSNTVCEGISVADQLVSYVAVQATAAAVSATSSVSASTSPADDRSLSSARRSSNTIAPQGCEAALASAMPLSACTATLYSEEEMEEAKYRKRESSDAASTDADVTLTTFTAVSMGVVNLPTSSASDSVNPEDPEDVEYLASYMTAKMKLQDSAFDEAEKALLESEWTHESDLEKLRAQRQASKEVWEAGISALFSGSNSNSNSNRKLQET
ncbi:hypothetical protein CANCADRAFT_68520 [Tortispora caseinolytica NRRL Y-17796]|uniref:Uncharacterized protein n=1 Tax=Tortispora caseinolytica NRRL Y-17796 TaxID=767744 RepID=A0A1E4TFD5_9ASCO|nr:hypothetical protein CANCADRAFT_68520 [Tortispora caseinolytica NRRL Y-17796]